MYHTNHTSVGPLGIFKLTLFVYLWFYVTKGKPDNVMMAILVSNKGFPWRSRIFHDTGDVKLYPEITSMMGGQDVNIAGPCFHPDEDQVKCKFGPFETNGTVLSKLFAKCVAPVQNNAGHLPFALSLDNGQTYPYVSRVQVGKISHRKLQCRIWGKFSRVLF